MHKNKLFGLLILTAAVGFSVQTASAQLTIPGITSKITASKATDAEVTGGLRDALSKGVNVAVKQLGQKDGFFKNEKVKIPLPKPLQTIEKGLRLAGQGQKADDFVLTMNRAAEKAVVEALPIFGDAVKQMTFTDARNIVSGSDDAATQFFKRTSEDKLREKFLPIVKKITDSTGVTAQYKQLVGGGDIGMLTGALGGSKNKLDIDQYVTQKTMDGLFLLVAEQEKGIRQNPAQRTTDLLRKIFGGGK